MATCQPSLKSAPVEIFNLYKGSVMSHTANKYGLPDPRTPQSENLAALRRDFHRSSSSEKRPSGQSSRQAGLRFAAF